MSNLNWFHIQRWAYKRMLREDKERAEAKKKAEAAKENQTKN